jgi:PPK2 family polyphosphate:nucleotide phosphotransferase
MDYRKRFVVPPESKLSLADIDPGYKGSYRQKTEALAEIEDCVRKMAHLQYQMYAEHEHSLLIVLQGLDASGKDGTIRRVFTGMNPQGCRVAAFKQPTPTELDHDFLWRVHAQVPGKGDVAIFNRSHYEDVLVARVHRLVPRATWSKRYHFINEFENVLRIDNETTILKFFLYISKEEQLARFAGRLENPLKQWKISESDYEEREHWDEYIAAYEDALTRTSTEEAPWFVIPANHKWFRDLAIAHIIVDALEAMKIRMPAPKVDLDRIREKYHQAAHRFDADEGDYAPPEERW